MNRQRRKGRSVACERVKPNTTKVTIDLDDEDETRNSDSKKRNLGETAQQRQQQQSRKGDSEKQKKSGNSGDHGSAVGMIYPVPLHTFVFRQTTRIDNGERGELLPVNA